MLWWPAASVFCKGASALTEVSASGVNGDQTVTPELSGNT